MQVTNTGTFRLDANDERLVLTVDGALWGETTFVFSRKDGILTRDGKEVLKLTSQTYAVAESRFAGPGVPDNSLLTVWTDAQKHVLYFSQSHEVTQDLGQRITAYLRGANVADLKAGRDSRWELAPALPTDAPTDPVPTPGDFKLLLNYPGTFGILALALGLSLHRLAIIAAGPGAVLPMLGCSALLSVVGAFLVWRGRVEARRVKAIYEHQTRMALPIVARQIDYSPRNQNRNAVEYRYQDAEGTIYHVTSQTMGRGEVNQWETGDIADVIVDRHDPKSSRLVSIKPLRKASRVLAFA